MSHVVLTGIAVPAIAIVSVPLAIVTGGVLYAHLLADLVWDLTLLEDHADAAASVDDLARMLG